VEDFNLRGVAETSSRGWDAARYHLDRFQRSKAAVSVLRDAIKNACQREGLKLVAISERHITHTCPECGALVAFDAAEDITCRCNDCDGVFDQDYAAATNLLRCGLSEHMSNHRGRMSAARPPCFVLNL
jgi:transposase